VVLSVAPALDAASCAIAATLQITDNPRTKANSFFMFLLLKVLELHLIYGEAGQMDSRTARPRSLGRNVATGGCPMY